MSLIIPVICPRGRNDCESYATIRSDCGESFICGGVNDGTTRRVEQDNFTLCFKNTMTDQITHNDERDLTDLMSVIAQTLSAYKNIKLTESEGN